MQILNFFYRKLIISDDLNIRVDTSCHLHQIVGKAVVIINQKNHYSSTSFAALIAFITAAALFADSRYSFSGILSATIPPPACT